MGERFNGNEEVPDDYTSEFAAPDFTILERQRRVQILTKVLMGNGEIVEFERYEDENNGED